MWADEKLASPGWSLSESRMGFGECIPPQLHKKKTWLQQPPVHNFCVVCSSTGWWINESRMESWWVRWLNRTLSLKWWQASPWVSKLTRQTWQTFPPSVAKPHVWNPGWLVSPVFLGLPQIPLTHIPTAECAWGDSHTTSPPHTHRRTPPPPPTSNTIHYNTQQHPTTGQQQATSNTIHSIQQHSTDPTISNTPKHPTTSNNTQQHNIQQHPTELNTIQQHHASTHTQQTGLDVVECTEMQYFADQSVDDYCHQLVIIHAMLVL